MTSPAISVAMSVYNGERFLAEAIESVLAQSFTDFEFLILDDGSQDGSGAIIRDYAARDHRIRPIFRENRGLIASLNQLLEEARAPIIARMDADDICHPERLERQIAFLDSNPDFGVIGTRCENIDENGEAYRCNNPDPPDTFEGFLAAIDSGDLLMSHPAAMFRRDLVRSIGGYNAAFRHCEDLDLWLRLASITKLASLPERLFLYRYSPNQISSHHATEQHVGAAIAHFAYQERKAGRPDPTEALHCLPPVDELDALFGREGTARAVRARVAPGLLYSRNSIHDGGFDLVVRHLRDGGARTGAWRYVARLIYFGKPKYAIKLLATLATSRACR